MGGGPAHADVVRASCLLTFPKTTMIEPVPIDAWYLYAVGLTFLRRLARDRVHESMKIGLLMQQNDRITQQRRYISVSSNDILRDALKTTFDDPEQVLVLHIVALDKVLGRRRIYVRPESNPNISPEPVEPMSMVFPTLAVGEVPVATPLNMHQSSDCATSCMRGSKQLGSGRNPNVSLDPERPMSMVFPTLAVEDHRDVPVATPLIMSQSSGCDQVSCMHERKQLSQNAAEVSKRPHDNHKDSTSSSSSELESAHSFALAGAKLVSDSDEREIPLARVVSQDVSHEAGVGESNDFVMLDLRHGAGLEMLPASEPSSFYISTNWHVHDMNASRDPQSVHANNDSNSSSMEDSFVILDQDTT